MSYDEGGHATTVEKPLPEVERLEAGIARRKPGIYLAGQFALWLVVGDELQVSKLSK